MTGLVVAGFHRSGTSSIAQLLESHGIPLGDDLLGANEFNRFGYFESGRVVDFHDSVLRRLGANWATLLDQPAALTGDERAWLESYLRARSEGGADWAVKDPRICRFLDGWKAAGPDLKVLIVYRSPVEACQSLLRRAAIVIARDDDYHGTAFALLTDTDLALRLWIEHNRLLLDFRKAHPGDCIVVGHDRMVEGFALMPLLERRFGLRPTRHPEGSTIDREALSDKPRRLPVRDSALIAQAQAVWAELQAVDTALDGTGARRDISGDFIDDPKGETARSDMAPLLLPGLLHSYKAQSDHRYRLEKEVSSMGSRLHRWKRWRSEAERDLTDARIVLDRLQNGPFRFYFMRSRFATLIRRLLGQRD